MMMSNDEMKEEREREKSEYASRESEGSWLLLGDLKKKMKSALGLLGSAEKEEGMEGHGALFCSPVFSLL